MAPQCDQLMYTLTPFWFLLKLGGRWPLETYIEDRLLKFRLNRWSPQFILFVFTSLFLICGTAQGAVSIGRILTNANSSRTYNG